MATPRESTLRLVAVISGIAALLVAGNVWLHLDTLGFWDGYVTAYDHATIPPHRLFCWLSAGVGGALIYLGLQRRYGIACPLALVIGLHAAATIFTFEVIDGWYLAEYLGLDRGTGG